MQEITECTKGSTVLPEKLCTHIYQCILEEVLDQLFILRRVNNEPINKIFKSSVRERYAQRISAQVAERVTRNLETFEKHFDFLEKNLNAAYEELENKGTYENLTETLITLNESKIQEENIKKETKVKKIELEKLEHTLYEDEKLYHKRIAECMADIGKIKDEIEDFLVESEIKIDYIEKWQNSKMEMNDTLLERKQEGKMNYLKKSDSDMYKETRVHQEILAAYSEMKKDIHCEINKWQEKYDKDYKEIEERIHNLNDKREKQKEDTRILTETFLKHQREINNYKIYKVKQEEKRLELKRRNDAATKLQAWWRGTMVRKGFGKYRKKKDKKGKKKESEKQGKK